MVGTVCGVLIEIVSPKLQTSDSGVGVLQLHIYWVIH